jgi:hypothetical protein
LYQVCRVSPDKSLNPATGRYFMFVLNVADGSQVANTGVEIDGLDLNSEMRKGRSSAVLINQNGQNGVKTPQARAWTRTLAPPASHTSPRSTSCAAAARTDC